MTLRRAVFLDRDGVLNASIVRDGRPYPPATIDEVVIPDGVPAALEVLRRAGFLLICCTNQPDVGRGTRTLHDVEAINSQLAARLRLDAVEVCYDAIDGGPRRKPEPGMLLEAADRFGVDLSRSFMVGDRWRDVEAGRRAGCASVLIDLGYDEPWPVAPAEHVVYTLMDAALLILSISKISDADGSRDLTGGPTMEPVTLQALKVRLFADGADKDGMLEMYANPYIRGFTTNPTLMSKAGITDYLGFAREILQLIPDRPLSLEVFSDDFDEMERQALLFSGLGSNVYVKIPITNTRGDSALPLVKRLVLAGIKTNVTAVMTRQQIDNAYQTLRGGPSCYLSVFAGRIADTGVDPVPLMRETVQLIADAPNVELIWASPRELLNVVQADEVGCHIITATNDILKKLPLLGKDLSGFSLETVQMFRNDAVKAGFSVPLSE